MKHIAQHIVIHYAGIELQVVKNTEGKDCVPLKPIAEMFGLHWQSQHAKVSEGWNTRLMGVCILDIPYAGGGQQRQQTCILLSRVAAYLMTINPEKVRAAGNSDGADYLEAKLLEWHDVIHDYEELGYAVNPNHPDQQRNRERVQKHLMQLVKAHETTKEPANRKLLQTMVAEAAIDAGLPYQPDLLDAGG